MQTYRGTMALRVPPEFRGLFSLEENTIFLNFIFV